MPKTICMNCGLEINQSYKYATGKCDDCGAFEMGWSSVVKDAEPELYKWLKKKVGDRPITREQKINMYKEQGLWYKTKKIVEDDFFNNLRIYLCPCGKVATGLHTSSCKKFQNWIIKNTFAKIESEFNKRI